MRYYEEELEVLIKAGARVVEVASFEWERVHGFANYVAEDLNVDWYSWSSVSGLKVWTGNGFKVINADCVTIPQVLDYYVKADGDMLLVLEDFHPYSEASNPVNIRYLREMMRPQNYEGDYKKAIVLSSPVKFVPEELSKELPVIEVDLPDRDTIAIIADSVVKQYDEYCVESDITSKLLESALGLTVMEARLAFAKAIIQNRKLTEEEIPLIISEKEQIIKKSGLLEYFHPKEYLTSVGGLENLKDWIRKRGNAYSDSAKEFGLNTPRGVLLLGVPGCGKSLTAKAIANEWKFPLLRFDLGKVFGGIVGESERNIRDIFSELRACEDGAVLLVDECESIFAKRTGDSNRAAIGVANQLLQEMNGANDGGGEKRIILGATNCPENIDEAYLRYKRFSLQFLIGMPNAEARRKVIDIGLKKLPYDEMVRDEMIRVLDESYTCADISGIIEQCAYKAMEEYRANYEMTNGKAQPVNIGVKHFREVMSTFSKSVTPEMVERYLKFRDERRNGGS